MAGAHLEISWIRLGVRIGWVHRAAAL